MKDRMHPDCQATLIELGKRVTAFRSANNITFLALARDCNIATSTLYKIEHGQTNATLLTIYKIAWVLGVDLTDLLPPHIHADDKLSKAQTLQRHPRLRP